MSVDIIIRDKLRPMPKHGSGKPEGSLRRTAQDGHLDSHAAPELWHVINGFALKFPVDFLIVNLENTGCVTICSEIGLHVRDTL